MLAAAFAYAVSSIVTKKLADPVSAIAIMCWMNVILADRARLAGLDRGDRRISLFAFRLGSD